MNNGYSRTVSRDNYWKAGDVLRRTQWGGRGTERPSQPFSDTIIWGFSDEGVVRVSRPYIYAVGTGTTGPTALMGCETYEFPEAQLNDKFFQTEIPIWRKIGGGRALPSFRVGSNVRSTGMCTLKKETNHSGLLNGRKKFVIIQRGFIQKDTINTNNSWCNSGINRELSRISPEAL